jgi:ABC-type multidrug transport system fused ATPase/permease subunit
MQQRNFKQLFSSYMKPDKVTHRTPQRWLQVIGSCVAEYGANGAALLAFLLAIVSILLVIAAVEVFTSSWRALLIWLLLAAVTGFVSRYALNFKDRRVAVSTPDGLTFLAVIMLGPYHGVLLAALDQFLVCWHLRLRPTLYPFNISNLAISIFVAGKFYYAASDYLITHKPGLGSSPALVAFALPLIALAVAHYSLHMLILALMAFFKHGVKPWDTISERFPWEPMAYLANATLAGLITYALNTYTSTTVIIILVLVLPIPVLIFYTFKTYRDKLEQAQIKEEELQQRVEEAVAQLKVLKGLLPICANCKSIRNDEGYYQSIEEYLTTHSEAQLSHGICDKCLKQLYPDLANNILSDPDASKEQARREA